jgi:hypothetical protein
MRTTISKELFGEGHQCRGPEGGRGVLFITGGGGEEEGSGRRGEREEPPLSLGKRGH